MNTKILRKIRKRYVITWMNEIGRKPYWEVIDIKKRKVEEYSNIIYFLYDFLIDEYGFGTGSSFIKSRGKRERAKQYLDAVKRRNVKLKREPDLDHWVNEMRVRNGLKPIIIN